MIKQLSVFVENMPGSLNKVTAALADGKINIRAIASFDTPEFGILRLVVDQPLEAKTYLTKKGFVVRVHEVIGVELKDEKGNLNHMLELLAENEINLNYIYSFVIRNCAEPIMVFSTDEYEKAERILKEADIKVVEEIDL